MHHRLICLALSLAAACGDGAIPSPDAAPPPPPMVLNTSAVTARERLQVARTSFVEPASYSYTTTRQCYCTGFDSLRISVTDGQVSNVLAVTSVPGYLTPVPDDVRAGARTVPALIERFTENLGDQPRYDSVRYTVELDPTRSFPKLYRETDATITDSDYELTITDFVTPADAP